MFVVGAALNVAVVAPVDHKYVPPAEILETNNVPVWPRQILSLTICGCGVGSTVTNTVLVLVHPFTLYSTVYVVLVVGLTDNVDPLPSMLPPKDHVHVPPAVDELAVNVPDPP